MTNSDAIGYGKEQLEIFGGQHAEFIRMAIEALSEQAKRKNGYWVEIGDEPYDEWECSMCGFVIDGSGCVDPEEYRDVYRFCPRCGSDMRGEQDDEQ